MISTTTISLLLKKPSQGQIFHLEPKNDAQDNSSKSYQAMSRVKIFVNYSLIFLPFYSKDSEKLEIVLFPKDTYPNLWHDLNGSHFMCIDR